MYFDIERLIQLSTALVVGSFYYFVLIPKLKSMKWLIALVITWLAGFILIRELLVEMVLIVNDGIYPLSAEQYILLGQDIFLALLIFSIGQLKFANDLS